MEEDKYYCYLCGKQLTDDNKSDEHIILNAIGGHLYSYTLLCKDCNSKLGEKADAKLAEDLSFFTDMLQVKRSRSNPHKQVMKNEAENEFVVHDAGAKYNLRKPSAKLEKEGEAVILHITARNKDEVKGLLKKCVNSGKITQKQADDIIAKASMSEHRPMMNKTTSITTEAFPSIVKSAVNFYLDLFHEIKTIKHLIPYIKGERGLQRCLVPVSIHASARKCRHSASYSHDSSGGASRYETPVCDDGVFRYLCICGSFGFRLPR